MVEWYWLLVVFFGAWWIGWLCRIADEYYTAVHYSKIDHSADSDNVTSQDESTEGLNVSTTKRETLARRNI